MTTQAAPRRALPTLQADGKRRVLRPKLSEGRFLTWRRRVGYALIALFVVLPFVRVGGKPFVLLDVVHREFTLFGRTFFATDGLLLALLLLAIFVSIVGTTALVGRAFCGWACPQTVYLELVFRPIERWFEPRGAQHASRGRRVGKQLVYALLALVLANVFLAYFVGTDALARWMTRSPLEHPGGALVVVAVTGLMLFDFGWFREQMCSVICPYARLQSALLDRHSTIVGYDARRGEPRKKGKPTPGAGDCIDCGACVVTCPAGIDIRDGLQLECIACAQCIDACDPIMEKLGRPRGLIRQASQASLAGEPTRLLRPRVVVYGGLLGVLVTALSLELAKPSELDLTVLRGLGAPFERDGALVRNQLRIKLANRSDASATYTLRVELTSEPRGDLTVVLPEPQVIVPARGSLTTAAFVSAPARRFVGGQVPIVVVVHGAQGELARSPYTLLGP
jgi:cytochrome c oxidase accessory protein FixG